MRKRPMQLMVLLVIALMTGLWMVQPVSAHERRKIGGGKYEVEVGWDKEPTLANQSNAATIMIYQADGKTIVEGADKTLHIKIAFGGGEPKEFPLKATWGKPGYYVANIIPTRAGSYLFTFTGTIDGTPIEETFESGPGRFDDVASSDDLYFPSIASTTAELKAIRDEVGTVRSIGIAGVMIGIVGVIAGGAAFATRKRK